MSWRSVQLAVLRNKQASYLQNLDRQNHSATLLNMNRDYIHSSQRTCDKCHHLIQPLPCVHIHTHHHHVNGPERDIYNMHHSEGCLVATDYSLCSRELLCFTLYLINGGNFGKTHICALVNCSVCQKRFRYISFPAACNWQEPPRGPNQPTLYQRLYQSVHLKWQHCCEYWDLD